MIGQISFFDGTQEFKIQTPVRLIELFAGVGAQAKALERLGVDFEHWRVCEIDENAVRSYNAIHGTGFEPSDITRLKAPDLGICETEKYTYILTYSFPCQDLSNAGKREGMKKGKRSGLLWEVERLLAECDELPQVLVMENVSDIINIRNAADFAEWLEALEGYGYRNYYQITNASDYGVAQNRKRCIMVSVLGDYYYTFPHPKQLKKKARDYYDDSRVEMTEDCAPKTLIMEVQRTAAFIKQATAKGYVVLKNYGCVSLAYPTSTSRRGRVIKNGDICPAVTCADRALFKFIDGAFYRISTLEAWRFMGFDDEDFEKCRAAGVSDNQLYIQAGNSIVVDVLQAVFEKMF